jgi:hypothetical protein
MGMAVERSWLAVRGPSSVGNTGVRNEFPVHIDMLFIDKLSQCRYFSNLFEKVDFVLRVAVNGHSSRIVSTIFEALKSYKEHVLDAFPRQRLRVEAYHRARL